MKYLFVFLLVGLMVSCGNDATGDIKEGSKNAKAKQPECKDIQGLQTSDLNLIPSDYTGVVFDCKNGKVQSLWTFKDGIVHGLRRKWYENGQLRQEFYSKFGKLDGLRRKWYENGQLSFEKNYSDGVLISKKCWDKDGNRIKCD